MRSHELASSPVDHYIQSEIVSQLYKTTELSFSVLKAGDIENSLFMYHMKKLIDRGVVQKTEDGFKLTTKGIRWVNFVGPSTLQPKPLPRLLINFILTDSDKKQILLSRRKGPASKVLNEYLLPGGLYPYGLTKLDAAKHVLAELKLPEDLELTYQSLVEKVTHESADSFTHHSLSLIYSGLLSTNQQSETEHFILEWHIIAEIFENSDQQFDEHLINVIRDCIE
ncbi:MAG TPA: hypothetical protein PKD20_01940 [Candidatus Saccharibacteria bacterium]|jgi:hypothetical protein|nr:hypothetical protein [Candidatus Saccharibacteria bacterium]HMT55620.1 hypothetical protein [Candidatus Saccharibacteria bacterium]